MGLSGYLYFCMHIADVLCAYTSKSVAVGRVQSAHTHACLFERLLDPSARMPTIF